MKSNYLPIGIMLGFALYAACGPSQPATNADEGSGASTASGTSETGTGGSGATTETGGAPATGGGSAGGESGTGGATGTGGAATTGSASSTGSAPAVQTPSQLAAAGDATAGGKLFEQEHCNNCHGTKAKGPTGKFPNLFKHNFDDKEIDKAFATIKAGKAPMPKYGDKLSDKQIGDIVAFLKANQNK